MIKVLKDPTHSFRSKKHGLLVVCNIPQEIEGIYAFYCQLYRRSIIVNGLKSALFGQDYSHTILEEGT
jgi:hypothetical protein